MLMYAGTQKAGSSWLHAVLVASGLSSAREKEWHHWDRVLGVREDSPAIVEALGHPPTWQELIRLRRTVERPAADLRLASLAPLGHRELWGEDTPLSVRTVLRRPGASVEAARFLRRGGPWRTDALAAWAAWMGVWDIGDFTPANVVLSGPQWREIAGALPDLRVIASVRDPAERLWSFLKARVDRGLVAGDPTPDEVLAYLELPVAQERSFVSETIADVRAAFPPEQVLVLSLDAIAESRASVLERLSRFVGRPLVDLSPRNAGRPRPMPPAVAAVLRPRLAEEHARLEELVGRRLTR
jgi:hypothetical protein